MGKRDLIFNLRRCIYMQQHFIITGSSYKRKQRIAIHFSKEEQLTNDFLSAQITKIKDECCTLPVATHSIITEDDSWLSVCEYDPYFKDICLIDTTDEFISILKDDLVITAEDTARYILSQLECNPLKLHKLVYLCFAEYLTMYNEKLFESKICAFERGPVVEDIYSKYKRFSKYQIISEKLPKPIVLKSRILHSDKGIQKLFIIDKIIKEYGSYNANELITITHRPCSPWYVSLPIKENFQEISLDDIKAYHKYEKV